MNNGLYDLSPFLSSHPGGSEWLRLTRGTDITEAFYVAHLRPNSGRMEETLNKFFVRTCEEVPRTSWFTFKQDGFYMRFKERAAMVGIKLYYSITGTYILLKRLVAQRSRNE